MRRAWSAVLLGCAVILGASGGVVARPAAAAETHKVDAWIELSSTRPAPGCTIDVAIEVRAGGHAVAATEVVVGLFGDDHLLSADQSTTDENGVALLTVDASPADGKAGWMDINVGGGFLKGLEIAPGAGSSCGEGATAITASGEVPNTTISQAGYGDGDGVFVAGVPFYTQQRSLSCEYASLHIATSAYGNGISEFAFDDLVGWSSNPHEGYRGDINGWWGNTDDYGVYAAPLSWALPAVGFRGEVIYAGGDAEVLTDKIDADIPVVVWLGLWGGADAVVEYTEDGAAYTIVPGMHVVVAYGYNDGGVYVSDPGIGGSRYYAWGDFMGMWNVLDGMALAVYEA